MKTNRENLDKALAGTGLDIDAIEIAQCDHCDTIVYRNYDLANKKWMELSPDAIDCQENILKITCGCLAAERIKMTYREKRDAKATEFFVLMERNFYGRSTDDSITIAERGHTSRADAEKHAARENDREGATVYYLSHNEYSRPSFFVVANNERIGGKRWQNFWNVAYAM